VLVAALACGKFGPGDLSRTIALEVTAPDSLEEYDTITPHARLLDGRGDSVAGTIVWSLPDSADTVALTLVDTTTGRLTVNHTGLTGRLLARSGSFVSNPISIRTLAAADTLFATALATVDTVALADSLSDSLQVEVADTIESASGGDSLTVALAGRPVVYSITHPAPPGQITLVTNDTTHRAVSTDTVATGGSGVAFVKVRLLGSPVPDSVVVTAIARRAVGDTVPGSPVTFVVRFQP
jgi:antitoxin (DNA-binding transcriptional repressor) of toxin-antitoxin stability system